MAFLFVGNLSFDLSDEKLRAAFAPHGEVCSARSLRNPETGRACGFGLVEMKSDDDAEKAAKAMNQQPLDGRPIRVACARPRENGPRL